MSDATLTDLYEVTMALSYLHEGMTKPATFSCFVRALPPERGFLIAAGAETVLDFLSGFAVGHDDAEVFAEALRRPARELAPLVGMRFTGEVRAVPEGRVVLAGEPLLEITAPLPQAQLVESYVLNHLTHQTTIASKCVRCVLAARGRSVVDFSLRRTQGTAAACQVARLGAMTGFSGTSNVAAAHAEDLTAVGTMAHSYIEAFGDEEAAFTAFALCHPGPVTFLVDTYATESGVAAAARVLNALGRGDGSAIRLDSGDLAELSFRARTILDNAGLPQVRIVASGGLDEFAVHDLARAGAPIDVFAVGTRIGVSADAPTLDSAYKLVAYDGRPLMKLSAAKATAPGRKQVFRRPGCHDVIGLAEEPVPPGSTPLLETLMRGGVRTTPRGRLEDARRRVAADIAELPATARYIRSPHAVRAKVSKRLAHLTEQVQRRIEREALAPFGSHA
ncbi:MULTISPECIES: nicotinate phosphoribosyltransferase [unclassified Streptomyces]|uniref:nicotinate phosphoribosyltransferase n=1 Tax=unclassified Streptomyces TaxID=2593676 RepID=UPI00088E3A38|nr:MULTISPECIES: nicotinate phosphoribosyltransferase [unclassified Streptomyces]PBC80719.1 nicotinate phosphoribosyltransferase [Streptomyces sp. 2321.6]SDR57532.1 nicotinate phosphoribosyltransferase [Streptomyces sp. KS_16]SEB85865.1 nicotinate phosphoribosyltransferase [Streptomyces sp. 2133.1]SNC61816.1 nicotinate phosphoribosyltransferase [Streptomyces sp. 2114.4]